MSQIEIQILKQGEATKKVYSVSFFTMKNAYRKFETYEANLKHFSRLSNVDGFCVRIYTDNTGQDIAMRVAEKYPHVSVYHFNCPDFREEEGHIGTFGTMVRFLPLFEEGLDVVWVSDIDITPPMIDTKRVRDLDNAKAQIQFRTYLCYSERMYGREYTIAAGTIISRVTFPRQILTKFINKLKDGGFDDIIAKMNDQNKIAIPSKVPYGIDELFTNSTFYNWLIRHDIKCLVLKDYSSAAWYLNGQGLLSKKESQLFYMHHHSNDPRLTEILKKIFRKRLPSIVDKYPCLQEIIDLLPRMKGLYVYYPIKGSELNNTLKY